MVTEQGLQGATGTAAAGGLILGFAVMLAGALLFISRPEGLALSPSPPRLIIERGLIMLAVVLSMVAFHLLADHLNSDPGGWWVRAGAHGYLIAGVLLLIAEALGISGSNGTYPLIVVYVTLALLAQAAIGVGIVRTNALPSAVGWITIMWNLAWLVLLPLTTPRDMYFPVLHHLMPLAIGISLFITR